MPQYKDIDGDSKSGTYFYNGSRPGAAHIAEMQRPAQAGYGLNAYINKFVRKDYAAKLF